MEPGEEGQEEELHSSNGHCLICRQVLTLLDNSVAHLGVRIQGDVRCGGCHQNYQQNGGSLVGLEAERGREGL